MGQKQKIGATGHGKITREQIEHQISNDSPDRGRHQKLVASLRGASDRPCGTMPEVQSTDSGIVGKGEAVC